MKKVLITLISILFLLPLIGQENPQDDHFRYTNAIRISPIDFGRSYFVVTYEKYIGDRSHSIVLMPTFMLKESRFESFTGLEMLLNYRFFLTHLKKGEHKTWRMHNIGFYAGPYISGTTYGEDFRWGYFDMVRQEYKEDMYHLDVRGIEGGLLLGVQFDITPRILIEFFAGGGVRYANDTTNLPVGMEDQYYPGSGVFDIEYTGVKPRLGLQLGFTF